jgi:hypothetical protein
MLRRREDKGGPIQLLFFVAKPLDWLERGSRSRKKMNIGLLLEQYALFCPPLKEHVLHPADGPTSTPN